MIQIAGKTFEWKTELKNECFKWNPVSKTWDRDAALNPEIFRERMILNAIESGDLRYANQSAPKFANANERTHWELEGQYAHLAK
ncbi:MAG: hypothetical protein E6Q97_16220 [Desulfurellales bacterium]|nr:MAG: hypothetical protein E6Q97_16220 [Desulfurellales bacterium]